MGVHLPPEILLLILDISLPTWPFIDFYGDYDGDFEWPREKPGYLQRYRALCRFALVHRTWLPLVRTLKVQYLFFDGNWPIERYLALKIRRDTLGGARTLGVSLNNGSRPDNALRLLHGKNQEIKYLETAEPLSSSTFAALTHLEILVTKYLGAHWLSPVQPAPRWPQLRSQTLRRLALCRSVFMRSSTDLPLFTHHTLPNLRHLAIEVNASRVPTTPISSILLPQLTTLALSLGRLDRRNQNVTTLFERLREGNNLKHLSLDIDPQDIYDSLFLVPTNLKLESLHLKQWVLLEADSDRREPWRKLASGQNEMLEVDRMVYYGTSYEQQSLYIRENVGIELEFRPETADPPFENLTGKE